MLYFLSKIFFARKILNILMYYIIKFIKKAYFFLSKVFKNNNKIIIIIIIIIIIQYQLFFFLFLISLKVNFRAHSYFYQYSKKLKCSKYLNMKNYSIYLLFYIN